MTTQVELSEKQKKIVYAPSGAIYVKASVGSGKTRVLTERVRHLLNETKRKVLVLTFTSKAAEEIRERLSDIPEINSRAFLGTFHGFCQNILENHGGLIGFSKMPHIFEDTADRLELVERAIMQTPSYASEYKSTDRNERRKTCYKLLDFISEVKRDLITDDKINQSTDNENFVLFYRNYSDLLRSQNAIDFDDLLLLAHSLLVSYPKTAALYRRSFFAICIDEAQDLNNAQYQLLLALTNGEFANVMMVGDPNQSIYHFNGSSVDYMNKEFVCNFKPSIYELSENYRSSKEVLQAARKIIPDIENIEKTVKEGVFEIISLEDGTAEAEWVIEKIKDLVSLREHPDIEGGIVYEKIAVLARNKYIFNHLEPLLKRYKIPFYYKMTPGAIKFESDLMKKFDLALRVKLNPQDNLHKQRLVNLLEIEPPEDDVCLESIVPMTTDNIDEKLITLVISLRNDGRNLKREMEKFRDSLDIEDENEKNMIFNDINDLLKHWGNYAKKTDNKSLQQFKNSMSLGQTHPLAQQSGITLSTVHTVKGQEFDIVFIIGADDGTFPDYRAVGKGGIEMTQEKNNLYVAFTRARRFLYVTWPKKRKMPWGDYMNRNISRFLESS